MYPDTRKNLSVINAEWSDCSACSLGQYRQATKKQTVPGVGVPGGIMFVGGSPGKDEEACGQPFADEAGAMFRGALKLVGLTEVSYFTSITLCRSCAQHVNGEGQLSFNRDGKPFIVDAPTPAEAINACRTRLEQEIYAVDPMFIVAMGGAAAEVLLKRSVKMATENGTTHPIEIPGVGFLPRITDKKKRWLRKHNGQLIAPVVENKVQYLCMVCLDPSYVYSRMHDQSPLSPAEAFGKTMKMIDSLYKRLVSELGG